MMNIGISNDSHHSRGHHPAAEGEMNKNLGLYLIVFQIITRSLPVIAFACSAAFEGNCTDYYVSPAGNDATGNGSISKPWKTLRFACAAVPPNGGHTINLSAGVFVESPIDVPPGVNITGKGRDQTTLKADPSLYYNPSDPGFAHDKFLLKLVSNAVAIGNQTMKDFTIDGDDKKLHGGILIKNRSNILLRRVAVHRTNFVGIWLWEVTDSRVTEVTLTNCAWGSANWSSGALSLANIRRVELDDINIDENFGYGMKALGTDGPIHNLRIHDNRISVNPIGQWKTAEGGDAPNIAFELWNVDLAGCEFFNNYVDNTISLVMDKEQWRTSKGSSTIRLHHNIIDLETRAKGNGYAFEVSIHDVEIDHNYVSGGKHGIVNWHPHGTISSNWSIHHNIIYGISGDYPADVLRAQYAGLHNVKFCNNTIEFTGKRTTNLVALYGGESENVEIKNNLLINSNSSYNYYPNEIIHLENAKITGLEITNNFLNNLSLDKPVGSARGNLSGDPGIKKSGPRPLPYYLPMEDSPVIDSGVNVGLPFKGAAPDIGAHETFSY